MKPEDITFAFENGKTFAIHEGKVIAAHEDPDVVEASVKRAFDDLGEVGYGGRGDALSGGVPDSSFQAPTQECPNCGNPNVDEGDQFCSHCGSPVGDQGASPDPGTGPDLSGGDLSGGDPTANALPPAVGHTVSTPNGLKGVVLGKVAGLWSDEVTVRLENGRIVKLPVSTDLTFTATKVAAAPTSELDHLEARVAATTDGTIESLTARIAELEAIKTKAANLVSSASYDDQQRLDVIRVTADAEIAEIGDAVAYLDDEANNSFRPPAPAFSINTVEQETLGGHGSEWLDNAVNDMIAEAESQDFGKIMDEGPEAFAAELPDATIADAGATRSLASSFISEKTAGTDPQAREPYMATFLDRVEQCRRQELASRKQTHKKEAAAEESVDFSSMPDDFLW